MPRILFIKVVLPDPFGPRMAIIPLLLKFVCISKCLLGIMGDFLR